MASDFLTLHADVRKALRDRLKTAPSFPGKDRISWEGFAFDTPITEWWRETLVPTDSSLTSLGPLGRMRHSGSYLIDVFCPSGKGGRSADLAAGTLLQLFPPNLELVNNGRVVRIERAFRSKGQVGPEWIQVPVTVSWLVFSINTI